MTRATQAAVFLMAFGVATGCKRGAAAGSRAREIVTFRSGALTLHGLVFKPDGPGPFRAILWNHGSYGDPTVAFDEIGPTFAARGWVFFGPFRRGQGLSAAAGPYIVDQLDRAGSDRPRVMLQLLTGDHLEDQRAAYAWLKEQPFVSPTRIAVAGNSFGGIETVLGAEWLPYCAAADAAGAAQSWASTPELHDEMVRAAVASRVPMFLFQAANDYDLTPTWTLAAALRAAGRPVETKIYPPFGRDAADGHSFAWHGSSIWFADVLAFLERHCPS
jgi:dienelactone hydrolase